MGSMDNFLPLLSILLLSTISQGALSRQVAYWKPVLPNTPMPSAGSELISPAYVHAEEKISVSVGGGGVNVDTGKPGGTTVNVRDGGVHASTGNGNPAGGNTNVNVGHGGVNAIIGKGKPGPGGTSVNVGDGGVNVNTGKGKPSSGTGIDVHADGKGKPPVGVNAEVIDTQFHDDASVIHFFPEKDLQLGAKMSLWFTKTTSVIRFLPAREAQSIPFSASRLLDIFNYMSVEPNSMAAETMKKTLQECEKASVDGENNYCAISIESMVNFSTSRLGTRDVKAVSTTVSKEAEMAPQQYTITGVQKMAGDELVGCHPMAYAYAVFYCQATSSNRNAYTVDMVGMNGAKVAAVAVCHTDTISRNPGNVVFEVLKEKPVSVPVCHFVSQDHVIWSRRH